MKTIHSSNVSIISPNRLYGNQLARYKSLLFDLADRIGNLNPTSNAGQIALRLTCANEGLRFVRLLSDTTFRYARWAVVDPRDGEIMLLETVDDNGSWIFSNCRPWNGGDRL